MRWSPPSGALGAVLLRLRARRETVVHMESGMTVCVPRGTPVRVVVTPDDLALVYVRRPAMRAVVDQALATARQEPARVLDKLLARRHWLPEAE
jgi:hypothetical protein